MKYFLITILIMLTCVAVQAQSEVLMPSSSKDTVNHFKYPFRTTVEILATNTLINRFDAWVLGAEWAKVSPESWWTNIKGGLKTDGDQFGTNLFGHPYHGSLYFNTARSNGSSFWGAIPYTFAGTLIWEYFGETEAPSEIDMSTTFLGVYFLVK